MKKIVTVLLIFVMIIALASCANTARPDWQEHLDLGQKYLIDGDYEQAIIEFNKVIEIEPKNVDAYLGLAEAYVAAGDYNSAISILEKGYAETKNQDLQDRINELRGLAAEQTEAVTTAEITTLPETTALPETTTVPATTSEVTTIQEPELQIIKQVGLGTDGNCGAITANGSLYMWGWNQYGQLGSGTNIMSYYRIKIMDNIINVILRHYCSSAITTDGSLYMWGDNWYGQLGNGTSGGDRFEYNEGIDSNTPIKIMDNVTSMSLGVTHSAAITADESLYMWGDNSFGQLGNGTTEDSNVPIKIMNRVDSVSLGGSHSAAITADGALYMWGYNGEGQIGNGTSGVHWDRYDEGIDSNIPIKIMDNVVSVSLGDNHSAAITTDGSLYMWGYNGSGQLGNGTTDDSSVPIKIMDDVASVSLGDNHSAAITTDGSLYMWGYNNSGQLGNGTTEDSYVPIKIMDNVVSVSLGRNYSAAITSDGSLYMWGSGLPGDGTTDFDYAPMKIEFSIE